MTDRGEEIINIKLNSIVLVYISKTWSVRLWKEQKKATQQDDSPSCKDTFHGKEPCFSVELPLRAWRRQKKDKKWREKERRAAALRSKSQPKNTQRQAFIPFRGCSSLPFFFCSCTHIRTCMHNAGSLHYCFWAFHFFFGSCPYC